MEYLRDAFINSPLLLGGLIGAAIAALVIYYAEKERNSKR
jgi:hypothetical protein